MMSDGIQPVVNLATENQAYNDGMFGGNGFWFIFLLFAMCGGGFGGWGNNQQVQDNFISSEFIKRDIFNTNQNVSNTACETQRDVLDSRYTTQLGLQTLGQQMSDCCCATQKEILESRYTTQLGFQDLGSQLASCCCSVVNAIHADGEATRALINQNTIQDLRDRLAESQRETDTANLALQNNAQTQTLINTLLPTPRPSYIVASPYLSYGYGCGCSNM